MDEYHEAYSYYRALATQTSDDELERVAAVSVPDAVSKAARDAAVEELSQRARELVAA